MTYNVTLLDKISSITFLVIPAKAGIQKKCCIFLKSAPFEHGSVLVARIIVANRCDVYKMGTRLSNFSAK
ncbi:MAG: hypothetical protein A3G33_02465 [Omnitrophica bacterium RIFCSPLOWO2_12_FULL_44_17]|uniref:Uncharacterized protein n=1 Tax=Candidatus Danuiimicrobium aquiferis TaxID=1801832 RepID=A0A1G1KW39_9BACT|nr:MAG: hypothetical protein A3E74_00195 [Omnitrophica bacterium RIFCSPHIGHO2_12_FULL_44_12]OGW97127.1 MAG: hypothetical protein A3G33_02465 [Omnitrophica bacterium RIFCSPLOWO2_12_FULL_44_17]